MLPVTAFAYLARNSSRGRSAVSAIAGIWYLDRKPAISELQGILDALAMYGPDHQARLDLGEVALGRCLLSILPEDRFDQQPLVVVPEQSWLIADVRLDNRDELVRKVGLPLSTLYQSSDAAVLLAAWRRWGESCLQHLVGAFCFAVWDARARHWFLARDHVGYRPVFFHHSRGLFAFATMARGLMALPAIGASLDEEQLALQLALVPRAPDRTLFVGIQCLRPGHCLRVTADGVRTIQYWQPDDAPAIRFRTDQEYADALCERFDRVVSAQLRSTTGVASHLSGGLDSSSVTATAARLLGAHGQELLALTSTPRPEFVGRELKGRFGDEGPAAAMVAARYPNIRHLLVDTRRYSFLQVIQNNCQLDDRPIFNPTNGMWMNAIRDIVQQHSIEVVLVGQFGNATLSYLGMDAFSEWFRRGHWWTAVTLGSALVRNRHASFRTLLARTLRPSLPALLRPLFTKQTELSFSLVHPRLVRELRLRQRSSTGWAGLGTDALVSARALFERGEIADANTGVQAGWRIDERDPTRDRRIMEFCFGIPPEQFLAGGQTRALVRRAMRDRLPAATLARRERGLQSADWHLSMAAERSGMARELARIEAAPIAQRCLDLARMRHLIEHWPADGFERPEVFAPWHLALTRGLSVGHFIRRFDPDAEVRDPSSAFIAPAPAASRHLAEERLP